MLLAKLATILGAAVLVDGRSFAQPIGLEVAGSLRAQFIDFAILALQITDKGSDLDATSQYPLQQFA
jgi:hypothetical protein